MSDTLISAIVGAVIGGIVTGLATYLITRATWKQEQKVRGSELMDKMLTGLVPPLTEPVVENVKDHDKQYIQELKIKSEEAIRYLNMKGSAEKRDNLHEAAEKLRPLMKGYFGMLEQYRTGQVEEWKIANYRHEIITQVSDILGNI